MIRQTSTADATCAPWCDLPAFEDDCAVMRRWVKSLRKTSAATLAEAMTKGPGWDYYQLSLDSAAAQEAQAEAFEARLEEIHQANMRWAP